MKSQNQLDFPKCAKVIAAFRQKFSELKVIYVSENGKEQGKK